MARTIHYKIIDDAKNLITDQQWEEVLRLQHWYNSEFVWTAGRLALKMFTVFPNWEKFGGDAKRLVEKITLRKRELRKQGFAENAIILHLATDGYIIAKKGGYGDNCIASGFTKVAGNEFNAYLVCEFLLKASMIAKDAELTVFDEGSFIKIHSVRIRNGIVRVVYNADHKQFIEEAVKNKRIFSVVNPEKYDDFPKFRTLVIGFNDLQEYEKEEILKDWNWLGFGENYDINGDDIQGYDLNKKVVQFQFDTN